MKLTIGMKSLISGFSLASRCTAPPVFSVAATCVLIEAKDKSVTFYATDTERSIAVTFDDVDVQEPGKVLPPAGLFSKILAANKNAGETVDLETEGDSLKISVGTVFYQIDTYDPDSFPELPVEDLTDYCSMTATEITDGYNCTNFATDADNLRYALAGVLFQRGTGSNGKSVYNVVATDGRRLSRLEMGCAVFGQPSGAESFIVPLRTFALAAQIAKTGVSGEVFVCSAAGKVHFDFGNVRLTSRLLDGRFPGWKKIIPDTKDRCYQSFKTAELLTALRQAAVLTSDACPGVFMEFKTGKLSLSVPGATVGRAEIAISPEPDGSGTIDITSKIDPNLAIQYLAALPADSVVTVYLKEDSSLLFESPDINNAMSHYILMPLS